MRTIYSAIFFLASSIAFVELNAQGCVAVRNMSSSCSTSFDSLDQGGRWQLSINYRYFRSFRHFRGREEEKHRVEQGTEVINNDNSVLMGVSYMITNKWSVAATIPYINIDRSSLYEHYGNPNNSNPTLNPRFHTQSQGLGDVRLTAYYSAIQTERWHLTTGLGFKLPTGDYNVKDYFHKRDSEGQDSLVYKVVDQSIQLGDGGFGFMVEVNANYMVNRTFSIYANGSYLFNPRNTNGIKRSDNLTANIPRSNEFSVADQLFLRIGTLMQVNQFQFGLGGRIEGIPSEDLIGKSDGWRRPGYIISGEPSASYSSGKHTIGVNVPIALVRDRTQNTIDKIRTVTTGEHQQGDAAFADWLLSISYTYRM